MNQDHTFLLVEDNQDDLDLTLRAFASNKFKSRIDVARDGQAALDYLFATGAYAGRDPSSQPVVVLLDLKLPKIGGLEVLRRMRLDERTRRIPVVVLTSSEEQKDIIASYDFGANSFVRKPVNFLEFTEAARQLGVYWLALNRPPLVSPAETVVPD